MIDLRGAWMIGYFRENQLGNMQVGDAAEVVLDVLPGQISPAEIVSFAGGIMTVNQAAAPGGLVDTPPQQNWLSEPSASACACSSIRRTSGRPPCARVAGDGDGLYR